MEHAGRPLVKKGPMGKYVFVPTADIAHLIRLLFLFLLVLPPICDELLSPSRAYILLTDEAAAYYRNCLAAGVADRIFSA
jgi:hypothetical protein